MKYGCGLVYGAGRERILTYPSTTPCSGVQEQRHDAQTRLQQKGQSAFEVTRILSDR